MKEEYDEVLKPMHTEEYKGYHIRYFIMGSKMHFRIFDKNKVNISSRYEYDILDDLLYNSKRVVSEIIKDESR
jgi:hypothetical protein